MPEAKSSHFPAVQGEVIRDSMTRMLIGLLLGIFVLIPLGGGLAWLWWSGLSLADRRISWWGGLIGVGMFLLGIVVIVGFVVSVFRRQQLVLGDKCIQIVVRPDKVTEQIPYSNIVAVELFRNHESKDFVTDFIGIKLKNPKDATTLCPEPETNMELHGWHYRLTDQAWVQPLEQICEKLKKRLATR